MAALIVVNDSLFHRRVPMGIAFLPLWVVFYAPALATAVWLAARTAPDPRRRRILYGIALLFILSAMEISWQLTLGLGQEVLLELAVCAALLALFRYGAGRQA